MSIKRFKIANSSFSLNPPNRILIYINVFIEMFCLIVQDENVNQTFPVIFQ